MFDLGLMELLLIGVTALIVVGPKDLPVMFRNVGRFMGRMRGMARDFQRAMEDAADESGMRDVERDIRGLTSAEKLGLGDVQDAARSMADWSAPGDGKRRPPKTGDAEAAAREVREAAARRAAERASDAAEASEEPDEEAPEAPRGLPERGPAPSPERPAKAAAR